MPQLDVGSFPSQIFWLFSTFFVFYGLMSWVTLPRLRKILDARERRLQHALQQSSYCQEEAKKMEEEYKKKLEDTKSKSHALLLHTLQKVDSEKLQSFKDIDQKIAIRFFHAESVLREKRTEIDRKINKMSEEIADKILDSLLRSAPFEKGEKSRHVS